MILWRKFIGDFQGITQEPKFRVPQSYGRTAYRFVLFGFGYDSVNDEIKIYCLRNNTCTSPQTSQILFPHIHCDMYDTSQAVLVGSGLHWVAYGDCIWGTPPFILAFDLATEHFHAIELPDKSEATVLGRLGAT
ncbi:hypothetical protein SLA2020_052620 [Shorea laevis]